MANPLVAFALVAEEYESSGDPIKGLKPLFAPILAKCCGAEFNPADFAAQFTEKYGLAMSAFVANALAERLVEIGLLIVSQERPISKYRIADFEWSAEPIEETRIDQVIQLFCRWATSKLRVVGRTFSDAQLEDAILSRLARPEFASIFMDENDGKRNAKLKGLLGINPGEPALTSESYLDYLVAEFILRIAIGAPEVFKAISQIAYGALIADAVAGLAAPSEFVATDPPLRVVLDGPLVLDLLDLNTQEHKAYAEDLLAMIRSLGLRIAIFSHSIDEMRGTIHSTVSAYRRGIGVGPLAERLRTVPNFSIYATAVADALDARVGELGISILRSEIYEEARYKKYFSDERVDQVRNSIGDLHAHLDARIRDAQSVATVVRLKADRRHPQSIFDAGTIFVTRNSLLVKRVLRVLSIGRSEPDPRFTIATDGQLAGVLWFVTGIKGTELSKKRLIANCSSAVLPKQEVVSRILKMLTAIDPQLGEQFIALMTDKRASLCPMRMTSGVTDSIDQSKSLEILGAMKEELVQPVVERAEAAEALAAERANEIHVVEAQGREVAAILQTSIGRLEDERGKDRFRFDSELAQMSHDLDVARAETDQVRSDYHQALDWRVSKAKSETVLLARKEQFAGQAIFALAWILATVASLMSIFMPDYESRYLKFVLAFVYLVSVPVLNIAVRRAVKWFVSRLFSGQRQYIAGLLDGVADNYRG